MYRNVIFHLLDPGYLLGQHRHWRTQNRLTTDHGEKVLKKLSDKDKDKKQKKMMMEKSRASVESSRNSCSSSSSSTTFSSLDCSKRVQTEWQLPSEPTSPNLHKKQPEWSQEQIDIRDVVKESMTRVIRVTKNEQTGPVMQHVDSPRPFIHQKPIQYERKDQNLAKTRKISSSRVKNIKETSRFSCDEMESQYSMKSSFKVKEIPRLSLDSKQNSKEKSKNGSRSEPESNKRPSSGIVARLMGLDSVTYSNCEAETVKVKPASGDQLGSSSLMVHSKIKPLGFGDIEKRLSALEFKSSKVDLKALKQVVEAMQMKKEVFENNEKYLDNWNNDQPGSPKFKSTSSPTRHELVNLVVKPVKMATEPMMAANAPYVSHKAKNRVKDSTQRNDKVTGRTQRSLQDMNGERPISGPRLQRPKNGIDKQYFNDPSSDLIRIKKQSNLKTRHLKIMPIDQSCMYDNETRNLRQDDDSVAFNKSESKHEVTQVSENDFSDRLIEDEPVVELAKLTMEQASPVSVLDAFYVEDITSPVKMKPNAFNDYDNLCVDETEWNQVGIYNLVTSKDTVELNQIELLNSIDGDITNDDHKYIRDILSASGFLKDPYSEFKIAHLHSTNSLIKPELFNILEKTNDEYYKNNQSSQSVDKVRRKLIFDYVDDILFHKLAILNFSGKRCERYFMDGEKLLTELWLEIVNLQSGSERCMYDDDEVKVIVSADLSKDSQEWDKYCYEVSGLVLYIERLILKDLIDEIVNTDAVVVQNRVGRHCRKLFTM